MHHTVDDWLNFHCLNRDAVYSALEAKTWDTEADSERTTISLNALTFQSIEVSQHDALNVYIKPSLEYAFSKESAIRELIDRLEFSPLGASFFPHIRDRGLGLEPEIFMDWFGSPNDILCLAHECGHGLQILLSNHALMPPVGREVCAFAAELLLMAYVKDREPALFRSLYRAWLHDNKFYLGSDVKLLRAALENPETPYHYRMNYPLARLAADALFLADEERWADRLFSSGSRVMDMLPLHRKHPKASMDAVQSEPMTKGAQECAA